MRSILSTMHEASAPPLDPYAPSRISSLVEACQNAFDGVAVNTPAQLRAAHCLRYQVFCVENNIFDPAKNPGGLECDEYDDHSLQAVLLHRATRIVVGTVRVVLHKPGMRYGSLPFHQVCRHPRLSDPNFLPLETTGEIGRFAISKAFRPPSGDARGRIYQPEDGAGDPRRLVPQMTLGLIRVALQMCVSRRIRMVCAVMEPSLLRLLARFGLHFVALGPPVDYYGLRQPCYANLVELFARVGVERPEVWAVTTDHGRLFGAHYAPAEPADQEALQPVQRAIGLSGETAGCSAR